MRGRTVLGGCDGVVVRGWGGAEHVGRGSVPLMAKKKKEEEE